MKTLNIQIDKNEISISYRLLIKTNVSHTNPIEKYLKAAPIIFKVAWKQKRNEVYRKRINIQQIDFVIPGMNAPFINKNLTNKEKPFSLM